MINATPHVAGINFDISFGRAKPFSKDLLDRFVIWLTDVERGFALRPDQIRVRHTDIMFDYELSAVLFNGNGTLRYNATGVNLNARGARTVGDIALLRDSIGRLADYIWSNEENAPASIGAHAYVDTSSPALRDSFLDSFRHSPEITSPGAMGYIKVEPWPHPVRVAIEATFDVPNSLFLLWNTPFHASDGWKQALESLPDIFVRAAKGFGVNLEMPADQ